MKMIMFIFHIHFGLKLHIEVNIVVWLDYGNDEEKVCIVFYSFHFMLC